MAAYDLYDEPFQMVVRKKVYITSANLNFQLTRLPWFWSQGPLSGRITGMEVVNPSGALVTVRFWDQDISNGSAPPSKGSGSAQGSLFMVSATASGASGTGQSSLFSVEQLKAFPEMFAGIAVQASDVNVAIFAEIRYK